ncbi:phosphotriesterase family protein [Nonomuraea roseoviolacea]|uniref:Phosphotriesterase-related protein n=1 Tax=Nonomuraea roseoviolacea subsp. carminata TaxID=160689 RepID=A0ABT1KEM3_9ACTN|nr:phosphotriesterase-related protein [Nonomuraea roseoviolacea]MCP2352436.1 phosphotriesterase-related protein [Nonomuraea roseoviolacea subsp. carminata]
MAELTGAAAGRVRTVLGDVSPDALGHTQPHEHVLCDMSAIIHPSGLRPVAGDDDVPPGAAGRVAPEFPASVRARINDPVRPDTYDWIRRTVLNLDNLRLLSEDDAAGELGLYRAAGGGTVVDSSPVGLGRDPLGLARVSRASGVHIVMGSGYYCRDYHPPGLARTPMEAVRDEIVRDVEEGVGDTGVRAGLIGEIGLSWPVHPVEEKVLRAACLAQAATGAPLQIHPGRHPDAPLQAMRVVAEAGGVPERVVMSHLDRTLWRAEDLLALAGTGCYLELDLFGQESSYYAFNPDARRPNDRTRVEWLQALAEAGHLDRLLVSQDICQKVYLRRYGGPGYTHVLDSVVPLMRRMGMSDKEITTLTVANPAAVLTVG